jgi:hypothetical protein
MNLLVTLLALREDVFIGRLSRTIDMELFMALLACNLVFPAIVFQKVIETVMTAPTLVCLKGFNLHIVHRRASSFDVRLSRSWFHFTGGTQGKGDKH